jgi:arylsulfatase A
VCYPQNSSKGSAKINIILIVADDLGRNDLGCYGNRFIETNNIDQMAKQGIQFLNAYAAAPLCSPSRASLITGNNPARINLTEHLHGYAPPGSTQKLITPRIVTGLPPALTTIAEALQPMGYATGHFGKWHLGAGASAPAAQGYQFSYGGGAEGLPKSFFYPFFNGTPYPDLLADTREGDYLDDALTTKTIDFIQQQKDRPFFVALNFYAPHVPIEGKPALVKKYADKRATIGFEGLPNDPYAAMVENVDSNVGRVINFLETTGLDKNTVVVFTSDNGGLSVQEVPAYAKYTPPTTNKPLTGGKGYIYEGGIRSPFIVWGAASLKPGYNNTPITTDDIFKTFMQLAGCTITCPDGLSLVPLFYNKKIAPRSLFWHFPHYSPQHGLPAAAVRKGKYKLIEWYETGILELFDLEKDESEKLNIAASHTAIVKKMKAELDAWRVSVNAHMPAANPDYKE